MTHTHTDPDNEVEWGIRCKVKVMNGSRNSVYKCVYSSLWIRVNDLKKDVEKCVCVILGGGG